MSSWSVDSLKLATQQSNIYGGFFVFTVGMIGNILNIIIFTSLETFRETSAAFYMNMTSAVNIFQLVVGLLSRILITGYNIDPTQTSSFLCKGRGFTLTTSMLIIFICMCLAAIDQSLLLTNRWRYLCNVHMASRFVIAAFVLWFLHGIPILLFQDLDSSFGTGQTSCAFTNTGYSIYYSQFLFPVLLGFLPLIIRIIFALLAFVNVRSLHNHQVPIVRLERDKQLTVMVLVEVVVDVIVTLPYSIYNFLYPSNMTFSDPIDSAQYQLIIGITRILFYGNFVLSFYLYCCVSSRFRKQLVYVLLHIHLKNWRKQPNRQNTNQIAPQSLEMNELA